MRYDIDRTAFYVLLGGFLLSGVSLGFALGALVFA